MKKLTLVSVALVALILSAVPVSAQTYLTTTILANAITSPSATSVVVVSATTADVGGYLYIDHEAMLILSISGTTITVARGQQGTAAATHAGDATTGATVIIVPKAALAASGRYGLAALGQSDPPAGSCTPSSYRYLPIINVATGNVWTCRWFGSGTQTSKIWAATNIVSLNGQSSLIVQ